MTANRPGNTSRIRNRVLPPAPPAKKLALEIKNEQFRRQEKYLAALSIFGTILDAAEAAGIGRNQVARWRNQDSQGFRQREKDAWADFVDALEKIVYKQVRRDEPSAKLLLAALSALRPERWGKRILLENDNAGLILAQICAIPDHEEEEETEDLEDEPE